MSRQSQKTEVVNKINIRIGDIPRKRKRRKRTLKPKNQGGFQHSPSGAFRRRTPLFAPTPMRPVYDGWARENMPTFQDKVPPYKKKENTTSGTQTTASTPVSPGTQTTASTPVSSTAQTPNQPIISRPRETASPGTFNSMFTPLPSTIPQFPTPFASPPVMSPDLDLSPTNIPALLAGLIPEEEQQISSPISNPFTPVQRNTGGATPLRRGRVNTPAFSLSFTR